MKLHVDFNTLDREAFKVPYGIALDGYVRGAPYFDPTGPQVSLNHHEDVDRLATRATCAQVLMSIRQGLFGFFRDSDGPKAEVFVNDCDEDVCTAWTLLKHHHMVESTMNPLFNRLVAMEDALDATAGAYPFPKDLPALRELAWIFEPYRAFRMSGRIDVKDASAYEGIICDVEHRILKHVSGHGGEIPLDTRYECLGGGSRWTLVKEVGAQARTGMFSDGIRVFVSVRERPNGNHTVTIGKMSHFMPINLQTLVTKFNAEDSAVTPKDTWGGANTVIGSPRTNGSALPMSRITELMNEAARG